MNQTTNLPKFPIRMKIFLRTISCFLSFYIISSISLSAQNDHFTIQLGAFQSPNPEVFHSLEDLGELRTQEIQEPRLTRILLGDFADSLGAVKVLRTVHERGFKEAFVRSIADAQRAVFYAVQFGNYKTIEEIPDITPFEIYGDVYQYENEGVTKIRIGIFTHKDTAQIILQKLEKLGYSTVEIIKTPPPQTRRFFQTVSLYKRMEGTINDRFPVVVHMYFTDASVTGIYNDPRNGEHKKFIYYGYRDNNPPPRTSRFTKPKTDDREPKMTHILKNQYAMNLTIRDRETGETIRFSLMEKYPTGSVQFEVVSIFRKKLARGDRGEMGTDLYLEYPLMKNNLNKNLENRFNAMSVQFPGIKDRKMLLQTLETRLKDDIEKIKTQYPDYNWLSETYETKILENTNYLLSVRFNKEHIFVEPETQVSYKSFDLKTGKELTLDNTMQGAYKTILKGLLTKEIQQIYGRYPSTNELGQSLTEMLKSYYFTTTGIVFFRNYHEDYFHKEPLTVTLPYQTLKGVLRIGTLPASFLKK